MEILWTILGLLGLFIVVTLIRAVFFKEKKKEDGGWINAGFMVLEPGIFDVIGDDPSTILEREPFETLASQGELVAYKYTGFWHCMDTQRDKTFLENSWNSGDAPWKVW